MAATPLLPPPRCEVHPGVWLDARKGVFFEALGLLVVSDLHWGYAESHRRQGNLVPLWGDDDIEQRLNELLADLRPREMVWLGDSLHSVSGRTRADRFLRDSPVPVTVLAGNHDANWSAVSGRVLQRGDFWLHHGDREEPTPSPRHIEVIGHHHPALVWTDGAGGRVKLPLLVASRRRLILPAFSPWAGGAHWRRSSPDEALWAVAPRRIFAIPPSFDSPSSPSRS